MNIRVTAALASILFLATAVFVSADEKTAAVDKIFAPWDSTSTPGLALAVIKDGEIVYSRGYGMANLEQSIPIDPDTVFYVGSVSKQFTAFCIALLAHDGKLDLDVPVRRCLPELPELYERVTIRQMVHHISGLRDFYDLLELSGVRTADDFYDHSDLLALLARQRKVNFEPGSSYSYSNSGYFLLAEVAARVAGMPIDDFARERIFEPLGMRDTIFHQQHDMLVPRRADGYREDDGGYRRYMGHMNIVGAGGVFSTVNDLARWDAAFYGGTFDEELLTLVQTPTVLTNGREINYAFGLTVGTYRGLPYVEHGGALFGFRSNIVRFPEQRFSVIILANLADISPGRLSDRVVEVYLGELMEPVDTLAQAAEQEPAFVELSEEQLASIAGSYKSVDGDEVVVVFLRGGEAIFFQNLWRCYPIRPVEPLRFLGIGLPFIPELTFEAEGGEAPSKLTLKMRGDQTFVYERVDSAPPMLEDFIGRYYCDELDVTYEIAVENGRLYVRFRTAPEDPLEHRIGDEFFGDEFELAFARDESGKVVSFRVDADRSKDLVFEKR